MPQSKAFILPSQVKEIAQKEFGDKPVKAVSYRGKEKAAEAGSWGEDENGNDYSYRAYIDPYTGQLLGIKKDRNFFDIVIDIHTNLMLGDTGRQIVDYSTLIFLVMLISGIILWWPHNKARKKSSYKIKWNASFKRKNYDLHNVPGFYASWILIFIVITGLAWGFEWVDEAIYSIASGGAQQKDSPAPVPVTGNDTETIALNMDDHCYGEAVKQYAKPFGTIDIYYPVDKEDVYNITVNPSSKTRYKSHDYYFDQRDGSLISEANFSKMNGGEKVRNMYYDMHIGKILGLPGQLLVFFAAIIAASLPVTGFLIWYGRRKKHVSKRYKKIAEAA